jgi:hypothetical protein
MAGLVVPRTGSSEVIGNGKRPSCKCRRRGSNFGPGRANSVTRRFGRRLRQAGALLDQFHFGFGRGRDDAAIPASDAGCFSPGDEQMKDLADCVPTSMIRGFAGAVPDMVATKAF